MSTKHIIKILDEADVSTLSSEDIKRISAHTAVCQNCRSAFQAARISSVLLKNSVVNDSPAPMPFFQAKVLNAWREKQNLPQPIAAFRRWWQASAAMVCAMILMVGGLISFSIMMPDSNSFANQTAISNYNLYSADSIILNQKTPGDLTTEQAFEVLESSRSNGKRNYESRK